LAVAIADRLADPATTRWPTGTSEAVRRQSLACGAPGIALLHIELAALGERPWERVHTWLAYATADPVIGGRDSYPYFGTYAVAHALACAAEALPGLYQGALAALDAPITADVRARLAAAHARLQEGGLPAMAEFDVIRGLAGVGMYLLHRDPADCLLKEVLAYMVALTAPLRDADGQELPGWWTGTGLSGRPDPAFPHGHGNNGMAHGIGGPLALLAAAELRGVSVPGQRSAITEILAWYDRWSTTTGSGPAWPYWVDRTHLTAPGPLKRIGASRPSWCYGAAGIARTHQLAALALADAPRRRAAEQILIGALGDPAQQAVIRDPSICHGHAGLVHLAAVAATDASPEHADRLHALLPGLLEAIHPPGTDPQTAAAAAVDPATGHGPHFLEGAAGIALALLRPASGVAAQTGWDRCLAITPPSPEGTPRP